MIDGGPIFTLDFRCDEFHDDRCPCTCHRTRRPKDAHSKLVRLYTQDGFEFIGALEEGNSSEAVFDSNVPPTSPLAEQEMNERYSKPAEAADMSKLRHYVKLFPIRSRPHFETRRRRRVPKSSSAMLKLSTPVVDDFYLNLLDWSVRNIVAISCGSAVLLMKPRSQRADFEILTRLQNPLNSAREEYPPPPPPPPAHGSPFSPERPVHRPTVASSSSTVNSQAATESDYTSVRWAPDGLKLAIGCQHGMTEIWDSETQKLLRVLGGHTQRIGAIDWVPTHSSTQSTEAESTSHSDLLTTGSRDKIILCHDLRLENNIVTILDRHKQEVCGLTWRPTCSQDRSLLSPSDASAISSDDEMTQAHLDSAQSAAELLERDWETANNARPFTTRHARRDARKALYECLRTLAPDTSGRLGGCQPKLASGGNDNKVYIWDLGYQNPIARLSVHQAAVKALTWAPCPIPLLVSGGGTNDRSIRLWDIACKKELATCETESQVCNLFWSPATLEIISSHGYTLNQVNVWDLRQVTQGIGIRVLPETSAQFPGFERKPLGFRKLATLTGHTARVLYMAGSPDGTQVCTAAGDGSVRLWSAFTDEEVEASRRKR